MHTSPKENKFMNDSIVSEIVNTIRTLKFGILTIKVHDSKITQIEVTEKKRYDDVWDVAEGGGGI